MTGVLPEGRPWVKILKIRLGNWQCCCLWALVWLPLDCTQADISPACWNEPRLVHSGPASAEFANRIRVLTTDSPLPLPNPVASPRNTYNFAIRQPDTTQPGPWHGAVQISAGDVHRMLAFEEIAQPLQPRWLTDNLLFLRVAWGRIQFSDLVMDVASGELVYHEQLRDGAIEFEQYRHSCADPQLKNSPQCACPADWPDAEHLPPSQPAAGELVGLLELPGLFGPGESGGPQAAQPIVPLALYPSPDASGQVITRIDDPWSLQNREAGYEAPAAVVLESTSGFYRIALNSGVTGWVDGKDAGHFMGLEDLLPGSLAYLTNFWDGGLWTNQRLAGQDHWQRLRLENTRPEAAIVVEEVRNTTAGPWLRIGIYDGAICAGPEPPIRWRGWIPAYSEAGRLSVWFHSRGC